MIYFTSDTHFDETRLDLFGRDLIFKDTEESNAHIIKKWNETVGEKDTVYHLGDVSMTEEGLENVKKLNGYIHLIKGNYDEKIDINILKKYFISISSNKIFDYKDNIFFLNHYPSRGKTNIFNIVGHIHGLWKVQRNMINVGCDAWHFIPVSIEKILFQKNGIENHYDENVFAGELNCNKSK